MDKEDQYSPQFEEQLRISIHLAERAATKKQLAIIEKKMAGKKKPVYWRWMAAAVFVVVAGIIGVQLMQKPTGDHLFTNYYTTYPNVIAPNERTAGTNPNLSRAFSYYENKDYAKAVAAFETIEDSSIAPSLSLYIGISLLELGKEAAAIEQFKKTILAKSAVGDIAQWYLGLVYIKMNQVDLAKPLLLKTANTDNPFTDKAKHLCNDLSLLP